jgi:hypothetical protein
VILISIFSILLLLLLPVLYLVIQRLNISLNKYQFWVMVGTGISWLAAVVVFFLSPSNEYSLIREVGYQLLPGSLVKLDYVSSALIMGLTTVVFGSALFQDQTPIQLAWSSGLGGICALGTLADSPFTLLLVLALIEIILLFNFVFSTIRYESTRRKLLAVIGRMVSPFLLLYAMIRGGAQFAETTFSEIDVTAGPLLIISGLIGALGWFGFMQTGREESPDLIPRSLAEILPAAPGLLVMIRGSELMANAVLTTQYDFAPGVITLVVVLIGIFFFTPKGSWTLGILGIIAGAAIIGESHVSLIWCLIYVLSSILLGKDPESSKPDYIFLISGSIGMMVLPFLPAWVGVGVFKPTLSGYLFAVALGLVGGRYLRYRLTHLGGRISIPQKTNIPNLVAVFCFLLTLYLYAFRSGLITLSLGLAEVPIAAWLSVVIMSVVIIFGERLPSINLPIRERIPTSLETSSRTSLETGTTIVDRIIQALTNLFEGDGGLIWALLVGFLLLTLLSLRGG